MGALSKEVEGITTNIENVVGLMKIIPIKKKEEVKYLQEKL